MEGPASSKRSGLRICGFIGKEVLGEAEFSLRSLNSCCPWATQKERVGVGTFRCPTLLSKQLLTPARGGHLARQTLQPASGPKKEVATLSHLESAAWYLEEANSQERPHYQTWGKAS